MPFKEIFNSNFSGTIVSRNFRIPPYFFTNGLRDTVYNLDFFGIGIPEDFVPGVFEVIDNTFSKHKGNIDLFLEAIKSELDFKVRFDKVDIEMNKIFFKSAFKGLKNTEYDLFQLVWANNAGQFPEEWEINGGIPTYIQPIFAKKNTFFFFEEKNEAVYTTKDWIENQSDITCVVHDLDGSWQFLTDDFNPENPNDVVVIAIAAIVNVDFTLNECFDLELGEYAKRLNKSNIWVRNKLS